MFPMFSPNLLVFSHLSPISRVFPHSPQLFSLFFLVPQVLSRCQGAEFSAACCSSAISANSATASRSMLSWTVPCRKIRKMHWWFYGSFYGIFNTWLKIIMIPIFLILGICNYDLLIILFMIKDRDFSMALIVILWLKIVHWSLMI